jgi:hypothetical protein
MYRYGFSASPRAAAGQLPTRPFPVNRRAHPAGMPERDASSSSAVSPDDCLVPAGPEPVPHCMGAIDNQSVSSSAIPRGIGREQPNTRTRRSGLGRRLTITLMLMVHSWLLVLCPHHRNRPPTEPVSQRSASEALHEVSALAQPPAGRGGLVACLHPTGRLLKHPCGDRCGHHDQRQLYGSATYSHSHVLTPVLENEIK